MKIQLPPFVLADLYRSSLVMTRDVAAPHTNEVAEAPWYLGDNSKLVSILVNDGGQRFMDDESLHLLSNMLAALQLSLTDVAVVNIHHTPIDYKTLLEKLTPRFCLMFNVTTQQLGLPFMMPDYKAQTYSGCKFLSSAALDAMKGDSKEAKIEKTKLWRSLQTIFQ